MNSTSVAARAAALGGIALLLALGGWSGPLQAQDDASDEASTELPRDAYTVDVVELTRWSDSDVVVKQLGAGEKVEVVASEGELLRVRLGTTFGWLAADQLSDSPPEVELGGGGLQLGGGLGLGGLSSPPALDAGGGAAGSESE